MNAAFYTLYHLMRADFWERVRRYSFLIVLGLVGYACYLFVPPSGAAYATLVRGSYRALYNSAGVGNLFGSVAVIFLSLFGFYLVKNAIARDYQTGVGQIIATTPISRPLYLLGKWLSNFAVLTVILAVLMVMALVMQIVRAETPQVDLWKLIAPIGLMGLPVLAIWSAFAVAFESIPFLRGGLGNVVAFFLWVGILGSWAPSFASLVTPSNDLLGMSRATASIQRQILAIDPAADIATGGMFWFQVPLIEGQPARSAKTFTWEGLDWTGGLVLERLLWIGLGIVIALAASIPFDRFDPSRRRASAKWNRNQPETEAAEKELQKTVKVIHLSALAQQSPRGRFFSVLGAELRLMFKGQKATWYLVALGLLVGMSLSPLEIMTTYLFPLACLWPVLLWSGMGGREKQHQTGALVLSVAHPLRRQLPALWLAGVMVGLVTTGASGIRFGLVGQWEHVLAWGIGILFIPSLALTLGIWSGGSKLFEVSYVVLWYLGILQHIPVFDFFGLTDLALASGTPILYSLLTILLIGVAIVGRWRQLQS
jgi:ABC-type transport system involved in multi-copper enzyme maturation permease subunit